MGPSLNGTCFPKTTSLVLNDVHGVCLSARQGGCPLRKTSRANPGSAQRVFQNDSRDPLWALGRLLL